MAMKLKVEEIKGNFAICNLGKEEVRVQVPVNVQKPEVGSEIEAVPVRGEKFMRLK